MPDEVQATIQMIPIAQIQIMNPRLRGKKKFRQITGNIAAIGLKKPITVSPAGTKDGVTMYNLVCGQGRLESYVILGAHEIPCIVLEGTKEDLMLMSLAENIARRQHSCVELLANIRTLRDRGYSPSEIARKTDLDPTYIRGLLKLLDKGEERLLLAVENGILPVNIAMTIATSDDEAVQAALQEAYEKKDLRGDSLVKVKRLIEKRRAMGKAQRERRSSEKPNVSPKSLVETYQVETHRQQSLVRKSKACESRLLMVVSAFIELFRNDHFQTILKAEQLDALPVFLAERIRDAGATP